MEPLIPKALFGGTRLGINEPSEHNLELKPLYGISAFNRLESVRAKLKHAKQHIQNAERECQAFFESGPYLISRQHHPQQKDWVVYGLTATRPIPNPIALTTGDALSNLRSVLDYLAWELVTVNGQKPTRQTSFPIYDSASNYQKDSHRRMRGMSDIAIRTIDSCTPWKGGNDVLWKLNELNNIHKHRVLITVGAFMEGVSSSVAHFISPTNNAWRVLKSGDLLTMIPAEFDVDGHLEFAFQVAFNEPGMSARVNQIIKTLNETLEHIAHLVRRFKPLLGSF